MKEKKQKPSKKEPESNIFDNDFIYLTFKSQQGASINFKATTERRPAVINFKSKIVKMVDGQFEDAYECYLKADRKSKGKY